MIIRIENTFHNFTEEFSTKTTRDELTLETFKRWQRRGCNQKDCQCGTRIYQRLIDRWNEIEEIEFYNKRP